MKESDDLVILGVTFDARMTFENRLRSVPRAAARKSWLVFFDRLLLLRSFWSNALPILEYCSAVLCSAGNSHLNPLDSDVGSAVFFSWRCVKVQP